MTSTNPLAPTLTLNSLTKLLNDARSPQEKELLLRIKARNHLEGFAEYVQLEDEPARHHRLVCRALDRVVREGGKNIMIFQPPGTAKSTYANILFSGYYLGCNPDHRVINCSYNYDLAKSFGRKARNLVDSKEYRAVFASGLAPDTRAVGEWEIVKKDEDTDEEYRNYGFDTQRRGGYIASGVGTGLTGRRGNIGIIDDPVKDAVEADSQNQQRKVWEWYTTVFRTRLLPNFSQILIMTRWNQNDLCGKILPEGWAGESGIMEGRDGLEWEVICMPAVIETEKQAQTDPLDRKVGDVIWEDYYSKEHWANQRKLYYANAVSQRHWSALYQQEPKPPEGVYFKREWFEPHRYNIGEEPDNLNEYIHSDFAVTDAKDNPDADITEVYSSGVDEQGDLWMCLDGFYGRLASDKWGEKLLDLVEARRPRAEFHEGGVIRRAIEPYMDARRRKRRIASRVEWLNPISDKSARLIGFQMMAASGRVRIPRTEMGDRLLDHLIDFPNSSMDHGPDACSCLTRGLDKIYPPGSKPPPPVTPRRPDYGMHTEETGGGFMVA